MWGEKKQKHDMKSRSDFFQDLVQKNKVVHIVKYMHKTQSQLSNTATPLKNLFLTP